MTDRPLQVRAGRNFSEILGGIKALDFVAKKLTQNEIVVLEGSPIPMIGGIFDLSFGSDNLLGLYNNSGGDVTADLIYVDVDGKEIVIETNTTSDNDNSSYDWSDFLLPGEKLLLRVTAGDVNAGDGVHLVRAVTESAKFQFQVENLGKIANTTLFVDPPEGYTVLQQGVVLYNFGPDPIDYTSYIVFDDGFALEIDSGTIAPAGFAVAQPGLPVKNTRGKIVFSAIPSAPGYLRGKVQRLYPMNGMDVEPSFG